MLQIIILPVAFDQTFHTLCVMHFNQKRAPETNNVIRAPCGHVCLEQRTVTVTDECDMPVCH